MYAAPSKPHDIHFKDWIRYIDTDLGSTPWITLYASNHGAWGVSVCYAALLPKKSLSAALEDRSWELHIGDHLPGYSKSLTKRKNSVQYHRLPYNGAEPLVRKRSFSGVRPDYVELSEEFRLFHNLYHDIANNQLLAISPDGDVEEVAVLTDFEVRVRLSYLRRFIAAKDMLLALYFSLDRYSPSPLSEHGLAPGVKPGSGSNAVYSLIVPDPKLSVGRGRACMARLEGKKLIAPSASDLDEEVEEFEKFVIRLDANGKPLSHTCDPGGLADSFGKNPDAAHYLTPVYFRRTVLAKYYGNPAVYSVEDGIVRCAHLWTLSIDNNHESRVVVYLGDLGRLPKSERAYWLSHNTLPEETISRVAFRRDFLAEFAAPEQPDLVFRLEFENLQQSWRQNFGWELFKPFAPDDEYNLSVVRLPLTDDQHEFDQVVMALAKLLIDSLNEQQLTKTLGKVENERGISKLERFLVANNATNHEEHVLFLRQLWELRSSGAGHRKSSNWKRAAAQFDVAKGRQRAFGVILKRATNFINYLQKLSTALEPSKRSDREV